MIDGGSTDGTLELLQGYGDRISVLVSEPDQGIYDALNKGLLQATGEVVGFLHSDDVFADDDSLARVASGFLSEEITQFTATWSMSAGTIHRRWCATGRPACSA